MTPGVWEIGTARLCAICDGEMKRDYLVRPTKQQLRDSRLDRWEKGVCQRCGKESPVTRERRFLMRGKVKRERGLDRWESST